MNTTLQEKLLDIKEFYIYNVNFQHIEAGDEFCRDTFMFIDYDKAMDYAFELAKQCICKQNKMPICYKKYIREDYDEDNFNESDDDETLAENEPVNINNIVKSECYIWHNIERFIFVTTLKLDFNNDIINTSYIEQMDDNLLIRNSLSQLNRYLK